MKLVDHIPANLRPAVIHAVQHNDRRMLNQIELRLISALGLQPEAKKDHQKWTPVGIAEVGRNLIIKWQERHSINCQECGGTGYVEARGRTRQFEVECPACYGDGKDDEEVGYNVMHTDIDGCTVTLGKENEIEFIEPNGCTDELSSFIREELSKQSAGVQP